MKKLLLLAAMTGLLPAADPPGFGLWTGAELKSYDSKLDAEGKKIATAPLGKFGNHLLMIAHRTASGEAELHETQADVFIVQSGEATLIVGGSVVDPKTTAPGEVRGPSISGGERRKLGPGDVVHIPAKMPHQLMVPEGGRFTYAVVKIDTP